MSNDGLARALNDLGDVLAKINGTTRDESGPVLLRTTYATVVVTAAPARTVIPLEVIQRSDPHLLGIEGGNLLHFGQDEQGREVVYAVVGWQQSPPALELVRLSPE